MKNGKVNKQYLVVSLIATITILIVGAIILFGNNKSSVNSTDIQSTSANNNDNLGTQIIEMTAKNGFNPNKFTIKAGKKTILRITTNGTYDCSSSIRIPSLSISKFLDPTGTADIEISAQTSGTEIDGTCGMGMYPFKINII